MDILFVGNTRSGPGVQAPNAQRQTRLYCVLAYGMEKDDRLKWIYSEGVFTVIYSSTYLRLFS